MYRPVRKGTFDTAAHGLFGASRVIPQAVFARPSWPVSSCPAKHSAMNYQHDMQSKSTDGSSVKTSGEKILGGIAESGH